MLTKAEIQAASTILDKTDQAMWLALIRKLPKYEEGKAFGRFPQLKEMIASCNEIQCQQLNAAMDKIEELGPGTESKRGGDTGIDYSATRDRDNLVEYALNVLYDTGINAVPATGGRFYGQNRYFAERMRKPFHSCNRCGHSQCACV